MAQFQFIENPISKKWTILAPRRAKRPDVAKGTEPVCPFCIGREGLEQELYRVGGKAGDSNWQIRVLPNKFPFAPIHEIIIHSPDHHKNFDELPASAVELILETYRQRYQTHQSQGQVYIFHNRGEAGGESLPHPHTQLAVVPAKIKMDIPRLDFKDYSFEEERVDTLYFYIFCPISSQWPDEVWLAPKLNIKNQKSNIFGNITDEQIADLANILSRLVQVMSKRHGQEFPFNFYIYPGGDWYLRIIPRAKILGGFELGTGVFVNTQDPKETIEFIKEHFEKPDPEKIKTIHQASYKRAV